ncbi:hypothetical protein BKA81DRAFT_369526 [Phyllosticta paracitricarpa]
MACNNLMPAEVQYNKHREGRRRKSNAGTSAQQSTATHAICDRPNSPAPPPVRQTPVTVKINRVWKKKREFTF